MKKGQKLVLNNPAQPLARNVPNPKLVKSAPLGRQAMPKQKLQYANPAAQQSMSKQIPPHHLGHFSQPTDNPFSGPEPEVGSLWFVTRGAWQITGAWNNTEAEEDQVAYLSPSMYKPHPTTGNSSPVKTGTMAIYLGMKRLTEWDGKGWARPLRPTFLIDGIVTAAVTPGLIQESI